MRAISLSVLITFVLCSLGCRTAAKNESPPLSAPPAAYEKIELESLDHQKIHGYLFKPIHRVDSAMRSPAIVALHGCGGIVDDKGELRPRDLEWGTRLAEKGYWVLYPDSFTTRGIKESCTRKDMMKFPRKTRTKDALGGLRWLENQASVDSSKIALMGWSNGGGSALWTLLDERSSHFKVAIAFYPGCGKVAKSKNLKIYAPLEILMGELDNWTGVESCIKLIELLKGTLPKSNITVYPGAYHGFDQPNMKIHERKGLGSTLNKKGTAIIGTDENARKLSIQKVNEILENTFNPH